MVFDWYAGRLVIISLVGGCTHTHPKTQNARHTHKTQHTQRPHRHAPQVLHRQIRPRPHRRSRGSSTRGGGGSGSIGAEARVADVARQEVQARGEDDELLTIWFVSLLVWYCGGGEFEVRSGGLCWDGMRVGATVLSAEKKRPIPPLVIHTLHPLSSFPHHPQTPHTSPPSSLLTTLSPTHPARTLGLNDRSAGTNRSRTARRKSLRVALYPPAPPAPAAASLLALAAGLPPSVGLAAAAGEAGAGWSSFSGVAHRGVKGML